MGVLHCMYVLSVLNIASHAKLFFFYLLAMSCIAFFYLKLRNSVFTQSLKIALFSFFKLGQYNEYVWSQFKTIL
jgi:hypothetical protein